MGKEVEWNRFLVTPTHPVLPPGIKVNASLMQSPYKKFSVIGWVAERGHTSSILLLLLLTVAAKRPQPVWIS